MRQLLWHLVDLLRYELTHFSLIKRCRAIWQKELLGSWCFWAALTWACVCWAVRLRRRKSLVGTELWLLNYSLGLHHVIGLMEDWSHKVFGSSCRFTDSLELSAMPFRLLWNQNHVVIIYNRLLNRVVVLRLECRIKNRLFLYFFVLRLMHWTWGRKKTIGLIRLTLLSVRTHNVDCTCHNILVK